MQINACNESNGTASFGDGSFSSVENAVAALATSHNLKRLAQIAERRLNRLASKPPGQRLRGFKDPNEFVNQAIELILTGQRKTSGRHLMGLEIFYNYVQAVIQSLITHELERIVRQREHVSLDSLVADSDEREPAAATDVVRDIAMSETKMSLFPRLREYAKDHPAMLHAIDAWEQCWPMSDRIPKGGLSDKQTHSLRSKARELLQEAATKDGVEHATGRESLRM
jgi:hypothetical protein